MTEPNDTRPLMTDDFPEDATHWEDDPETGAAVPCWGWRGETCKRCGRRNPVGFSVSDTTWRAVVQGRWQEVCLACFDELAELDGVKYTVLSTHLVSWSDWRTPE